MSLASAPEPRRAALPTWVFLLGGAVVIVSIVVWACTRPRAAVDHWKQVARARRYFERGLPDLAFQEVAGIRDEAPGAPEALTLAARALLSFGEISTARKTLEHSLQLKRDQADADKMLAAIYLSSGDGPRGITLLQHAAELDPRDFRPWYALGKVYHDLNDAGKAAEAYSEALRRSPPEAEANDSRVGRIRALLDARRVDQASADIAGALVLMPDNPQLLGQAARHACEQHRSDEAMKLADRAITLDPNNFDAHLARARLHLLADRSRDALADAGKAVEANPRDLSALQLLMQIQSRLGLKEQAEATRSRFRETSTRRDVMVRLTHKITEHPDDPEPRCQMGRAAYEDGSEELAAECFRAALDLDPNYMPARQALAILNRSRRETSAPAGPKPKPATAAK